MNSVGEMNNDRQPSSTQWDTLVNEPFAGDKSNTDVNNSEKEKSAFEKFQERKDQYALDAIKLMGQKYNEGSRIASEGGSLMDLEKMYDKKLLDLQTQYLQEQGKLLIEDKEMQTNWNNICTPTEDEKSEYPSRQSLERAVDSMIDLESGMDLTDVVARYYERSGIPLSPDLVRGGIVTDLTPISRVDKLGTSLVTTFSKRGKEFGEVVGAKPLSRDENPDSPQL